MTEIDTNILEKSGLTQEQAEIYSFLLSNGLSPAKLISKQTSIGRALTYKILDRLIELGLAEKREGTGKITMFFPGHPSRIKDLVEKEKTIANEAISMLTKIMPSLSSNYNLLFGKPNVQFYEGIEGLSLIYDDILETNQDISIISSPAIDEGRQEVLHLIKEQIEKQVAQNIKTKAITPFSEGQKTSTPISEDEKYLITRKIVPAEKLKIPAQIIIYGNKVAITNFKETIISVLVESKYIAETFRIMFDYIWQID